MGTQGGGMMNQPNDESNVSDEHAEAADDALFLMELLEDSGVTQHEAGMLHVLSGRIIAWDPACGTEPAFQRTVPPGRYRVVAGTVDTEFEGTRVAYLALWIKATPIVREEEAYLDGSDSCQY